MKPSADIKRSAELVAATAIPMNGQPRIGTIERPPGGVAVHPDSQVARSRAVELDCVAECAQADGRGRPSQAEVGPVRRNVRLALTDVIAGLTDQQHHVGLRMAGKAHQRPRHHHRREQGFHMNREVQQAWCAA